MNRNNVQTIALRARDKARSLRNRVAAGFAGMVASGAALATTSVGQTAATEISGAESQIELVQTAMLGVLILLVVFGLIRKSFGK